MSSGIWQEVIAAWGNLAEATNGRVSVAGDVLRSRGTMLLIGARPNRRCLIPVIANVVNTNNGDDSASP